MTAKWKLALVLSTATLAAVACTNGDDDPEPTPQPTDEPRIEQVASFQIVGTIEKAFAGADAPLDVPDAGAAEISGATAGPAATPVGDAPSIPGVLRMAVEDVNQELTDACGVAADSEVRVYWTTDTKFDPSDVLDDLEDEIEDKVAGISGRVFGSEVGDTFTPEPDEADEPTQEPDLTNASPFAIGSPDAGDNAEPAGDCVLVADQIGFESGDAPATRAPSSVRRTAPPTATPEETDSPTPTPDESEETEEPNETPDDTATPTASQDE